MPTSEGQKTHCVQALLCREHPWSMGTLGRQVKLLCHHCKSQGHQHKHMAPPENFLPREPTLDPPKAPEPTSYRDQKTTSVSVSWGILQNKCRNLHHKSRDDREKTVASIFPDPSPPLFFETQFDLNLVLIHSAPKAGQGAPGILLALSQPQC